MESILNQTYQNTEVIIINDGSTDRTDEIINIYKQKDQRVKYFYQTNSGPSEARNRGLKESTGNYIVFVDSDDIVDKYYVAILLKKMLSSSSDIACCGYNDVSIYGTSKIIDFNYSTPITKHLFMRMCCYGTGGVLWGKIFKREIIIKNNLELDKNIFMCEDLIFVLQYSAHCSSFSVVNEYLYHYNRFNEGSISSNISINYIDNYVKVWSELENIFDSVNHDKQKTNQILCEKVQEITMFLLEQQSKDIRNIGIKATISNIKKILNTPYVEAYRNYFSSDNYFYKPYIYLLKINSTKLIFIYGAYINLLRSSKRRLLRRG